MFCKILENIFRPLKILSQAKLMSNISNFCSMALFPYDTKTTLGGLNLASGSEGKVSPKVQKSVCGDHVGFGVWNAVVGDIEGELPAAEERQEGLGGGEAGAVVVVAVFRRAHVGHEGGGEGREGKDRVSNLCLN